jgi:hypothetical protein
MGCFKIIWVYQAVTRFIAGFRDMRYDFYKKQTKIIYIDKDTYVNWNL